MTAKVVYTTDLRTVATHLQSGSVIETDAPTDNQGKGDRFSPTDLVATALASCIVTTMAIGGKTHNINVDGTACEVTKVMIADPRRIGEIVIKVIMPKGSNYNDKEKAILERIANTCPVHASLHPDLKKSVTFDWG